MNGLLVEGVTKRFGHRTLLTDVHLQLMPGEVVGLLGRNGSGKSTLMKIISRSMSTDYPYFRVDGDINPPLRQYRKLVRYKPQINMAPGHLTVARMLRLLAGEEGLEQVRQLARVWPHMNDRIGQLPGSLVRYLEVVALLHSPARYVLLDEPFAGLDPLSIEELSELILRSAKTRGILLSDLRIRFLQPVATRMVLLQNGVLRPFTDHQQLRSLGYLPEI